MQQNKNSRFLFVLLLLIWPLYVSADEKDVCELTKEVKTFAYNNTPQETVKYLEGRSALSSCEYSLIHFLHMYFGIESIFSEKERLENIDSNDPSMLVYEHLLSFGRDIDINNLGALSEMQKNQLLSMYLVRNYGEKTSRELISKMQFLTLDPTSSYMVFNARKLSQTLDVHGGVKPGGDICSLVYTVGRSLIDDYECFYFSEAIMAFNKIEASEDFTDISEGDINAGYTYIVDYYKKRIGNVIGVRFDFLERCENYKDNFNIYKRCLPLALGIHLKCDFSFNGLERWESSVVYEQCFEQYLLRQR